MTNESKLQIVRNVIPLFEKSLSSFSGAVEKPIWDGNEEDFQPRFNGPNSGHFQLLMVAKLLSTLNAILYLLEKEYAQEVGVLVRVAEECLAKILFIEEAHLKKELNSEQKKLIDEYFKFDIRSCDDILNGNKWWVDMKRVFASNARYLSDGTPNKDVCGIQKNVKAIYDTYSGYVHGFYPHVMELYDMEKRAFEVNGCGAIRQREMLSPVSSLVLRTFNVLAQIAPNFNCMPIRDELIKNRDLFMATEAYRS